MKPVHATVIAIAAWFIFLVLVGVFPTTNVHTVVRYVKEPALTIQQQQEQDAINNCWTAAQNDVNHSLTEGSEGRDYSSCIDAIHFNFSLTKP